MKLRLATLADVPAIEPLIEASVRKLQANDYTAQQLEASLGTVYGVDRQLIEDGTYFVVETDEKLAGCGGWSFRRTLFGADANKGRDSTELRPGIDAARIRAFFVAPDMARSGIGTRILHACEDAAVSRGFTAFELAGTLTGVPFYARHGYVELRRFSAEAHGGIVLEFVAMRKVSGVYEAVLL